MSTVQPRFSEDSRSITKYYQGNNVESIWFQPTALSAALPPSVVVVVVVVVLLVCVSFYLWLSSVCVRRVKVPLAFDSLI